MVLHPEGCTHHTDWAEEPARLTADHAVGGEADKLRRRRCPTRGHEPRRVVDTTRLPAMVTPAETPRRVKKEDRRGRWWTNLKVTSQAPMFRSSQPGSE